MSLNINSSFPASIHLLTGWRHSLSIIQEKVNNIGIKIIDYPITFCNVKINDIIRYIIRFRDQKITELVIIDHFLVGAHSLNLSSLKISSIPRFIGNLTNLTTLHICYNFDISSLPESIGNLTNLKKLILWRSQFSSLPNSIGNLTNLTELCLGYNNLSSLPESIGNLTNLTLLNLSHNRISTVPDCLFNLHNCRINIEGNPISEDTIQALRARISVEGYEGPSFIFSTYEDRLKVKKSNELVFADWLSENSLIEIQTLPIDTQETAALWLDLLNQTADGKDLKLKHSMEKIVQDLFHWILCEATNEEQASAWNIIKEATETCGDRVSLSLNELHVLKEQSNPKTAQSIENFKSLVIGLIRLELLYKSAREIAAAQRLSDPIEVILALQTALKETLQLPLIVQDMLYRRMSSVSEAEIDEVGQSILNITQNTAELLAGHPLWQNRITKTCSDFQQRQNDCQESKNTWLEKHSENITNEDEIEFQKNEQTIWNPYFTLTQEILARGTFEENRNSSSSSQTEF